MPPAGRPRWVCPERAQLDLLYLSWGRRRFGESPIPVSLHHGWLYVLICKGNPQLSVANRLIRTQPGQVFIIDPDCASGWSDTPRGVSELMTWAWRTSPKCAECAPSPAGFRQFHADDPLLRKLKHIHTLCRAEVQRPDALTKLAMEQARLQMDLVIARSQRSCSHPPQSALRLELALRWIALNLAEPYPVAALCEYLQIAPSTLNRLFRSHLRESVASYQHRLKMERACRMLKAGNVSVKEVAYLLGYKHPHDFSRAVKNSSGFRPGDLIPRPRASAGD